MLIFDFPSYNHGSHLTQKYIKYVYYYMYSTINIVCHMCEFFSSIFRFSKRHEVSLPRQVVNKKVCGPQFGLRLRTTTANSWYHIQFSTHSDWHVTPAYSMVVNEKFVRSALTTTLATRCSTQ